MAANETVVTVPEDEDEDQPRECWICGSTETVEISDERQSITVCAGCGSDE